MKTDLAQGCLEYQKLTRRRFLTTGIGAAASVVLSSGFSGSAAAQIAGSERDTLISIFLRGGCDGLTLCVPHGEDAYYSARPSLRIPQPGGGSSAATSLDGFFGLPPAMTPLLDAYNAGHFLFVHACGSKNDTRSHFDAQHFMEIGEPGMPLLATGWLGRHLLSVPPRQPAALLRAIGMRAGLQTTLAGSPLALPIPDPSRFGLLGSPATKAARLEALEALYAAASDPLYTASANTLATIGLVESVDILGYQPSNGAEYAQTDFGDALRSAAALIKADVGIEAFAVDAGGWDTHNGQEPLDGLMATLMDGFARSLAAFYTDVIAGGMHNVTVVIMSEFGRKVKENGSRGTDHGHGNVMMLLGRNVAGGQVLTQWPGLQPEHLFEEQDLEVTIDYRDVLAELITERLGNTDLGFVFPGFTPTLRGVTA
ncbi:MAG: DUF1501 domain-containing protein [Candidatus Hydrogenedentes bacterium]|nr:DUF1501 domain-containing protein [Candidatus Hydrogenedentota bacterium]